MRIFQIPDGTYGLYHYKIPWLKVSVFFLLITVLGTEFTRWGVPLTKSILPWEFPLPFLISFLFTGLSIGIYVLKNPNNFLLNIFLFLLFSSSVGTLGWSVIDEFCMLFIALALLFLIKKNLFIKRNSIEISFNRVWIFLFFSLLICLLISSVLGMVLWGQYKAIRFTILFFSVLVFSYTLIFYRIRIEEKAEIFHKLLKYSALYFLLILIIGLITVLFEPKSELTFAIFIFRGLGDISYVNAMFPAIISVPLAFYLLSKNISEYGKLSVLNIFLAFLASMLMDTRAGLLIFILCVAILPISLGLFRTIKFLTVGILFTVITTTILIGQPSWFIDTFWSLTEVFDIKGGSYILDYYGETYSATKGDIGRYMLAYCSLIAAIDQPLFFLTGAGNYAYWQVMDPYITAFRIEYNLSPFNLITGIGGEAPRPPALGAWIIENGIIGFSLIMSNILASISYLAFYKKNNLLFLEDKSMLLMLIPIVIIPIWAYFSEFQDNAFLYLIIMPFGFMYLLKESIKDYQK